MIKYILGLDLGVSSVGWCLIKIENGIKNIVAMGSRILPIDGAEIIEFQKGNAQTKNADRRTFKSIRKGNKRYKVRRNKLIYVLQKLNMLPEQILLSHPFDDPNKIEKVNILPIKAGQKQITALDLLQLRVKALNEKVENPKDLGKLFYLFNQLRGYSGGGNEPEKEEQTDSELENSDNQVKKYEKLIEKCRITQISKIETKKTLNLTDEKKPKDKFKIHVVSESGEEYEGETELETLVIDESYEFQITIRRDKKTGKETSVVFTLPKKTNWRKKMEDLEAELEKLKKEKGREVYISEYFLEKLKENRWKKIRNNVILRSRYQAEFDKIWETQSRYYTILKEKNSTLVAEIANFIFPGQNLDNNPLKKQKEYREKAIQNGLKYLVRDQIIYFQRELKDQSDLISNCRFEEGKKVVSKSHPTFQEYKIWEQINKLSINTKTENGYNRKGEIRYKYEDRPIPAKLKADLYELLQEKKEIKFSEILKKLKSEYGLREGVDFLNGINPKAAIRGNDTKQTLKKSLGKLWDELKLDDESNLIALWKILYNGKGNEYDINSPRTSQILSILKENKVNTENLEKIAIQISKIKFARNYASMSLEAIEKILPLVRAGKYYENKHKGFVKERISTLYNENLTDAFEIAVQEFFHNNPVVLEEGGIQNSYATILVYGKHTEKEITADMLLKSPKEIKRLEQNSLRNPLAEQIINETLMVVKEIWKEHAKPDEIRIELTRELKNNAEERAKIYKMNQEGEKLNKSVIDRLVEDKIDPTLGNIERYKLWQSQNQQSPYTGSTIQYSDVFDKGKFDIDHILPKSRYFDDSFSNKILAETDINREKGNRTAMEYIEQGSVKYSILNKEQYIDFVNATFSRKKRKNLLATKIPQDPINRQLKDTQYINVRAKQELYKLVGNENIKTSTGGVTDYLRHMWGLTEKFKHITKERFEALGKSKNEVWVERVFDEEKKKHVLKVKNWSKRIDHRHQALDALIVACTEPSHIQKLNNLNKELQKEIAKEKTKLFGDKPIEDDNLLEEFMQLSQEKRNDFMKSLQKSIRKIELPWKGFIEEAEKHLLNTIISQKSKEKLIIQPQKGSTELGLKIRGQLHNSTIYGKSEGKECYRIPLTKLADNSVSTEKTINKIVHPFLRETILTHFVKTYKSDKKEAFSAEGILELNKTLQNRKKLKNGVEIDVPHPPIDSVKIFYQEIGKKKTDDDTLQRLERKKSFNSNQFVETGGNYAFAALEKEGKRDFDLISFFDAVNLIKLKLNETEQKQNVKIEKVIQEYFELKHGCKVQFTLKQGDYVYLPQTDELELVNNSDFWKNKAERAKNVYVVVKFSGKVIYFIKHDVAKPIENKVEFGTQNCFTQIDGISIKDHCIKLRIDRLGNISKA